MTVVIKPTRLVAHYFGGLPPSSHLSGGAVAPTSPRTPSSRHPFACCISTTMDNTPVDLDALLDGAFYAPRAPLGQL